MIPIIFGSDAITFTSNGLGRLTDCISCLVTEARNGIFECEFTYPITGVHYDRIQEGNIVVVSHDEQKDKQPFIIYRISRPINGVVTVNAHHITYRLSNIVISPFTASSVADAFNSISENSMIDNPFTFWTDNTTAGSMDSQVPASARSLLGGVQGSVLDVFGGEYAFDGFTVKNYAHRGSNKGVTIRYGKNLVSLTAERNALGVYNAVVPFWSDHDSTVVYGGIVVGNGGVRKTAEWTDENDTPITDENSNIIDFGYYVREVTVMDLSQDFSEKPTVEQLETKARTKLNSSQPWIPKENIKVDFVALWQTEEYKNIAPLERVQLCDTVNIYYPELGVDATAKVIKVVWNALLERYDSIELGDTKSSFADTITNAIISDTDKKLEAVPTTSMMDEAINHATDLITGGLGGNVVFLYDANGKPTDMLVMDTEDVNTAVHVLRINVNGIGFSSSGISGPYTSAWTLDGEFVADFITTGYMRANRIKGGTLTLGGSGNGNGVLVVYDASGTEIARLDNTGLKATGDLKMHKETTKNNVKYTGDCTVGEQVMVARMTGGAANVYQRDSYLGFYLACKRGANSDKFNYYRAITMNSAWSSDTILAKGDAVRAMLATYNQEWDTSILNGTTSLNSLTQYCSGYVEMVESVSAGLLPRYELAFIGYGSDNVNNYNNINSYVRIYENFKAELLGWMVNFYASYMDIRIDGAGSAYIRYNYNSSGYWTIKGTNQSGNIAVQGSSAKRYKHDITDDISEELDPHKLYELTMKQFVFNDDCESWEYPDMKGKTLPGFIAEDVEEIYPAAAIHNNDGDIENWDVRRIVPGMLKLIQEQHEVIESLKTRLAKLENVVEKLTNDMR